MDSNNYEQELPGAGSLTLSTFAEPNLKDFPF
jgi:hypothetical protein